MAGDKPPPHTIPAVHLSQILARCASIMARPPRLEDGSYIGRRQYFVTFSTFERQPLLTERETAGSLREQLLRSSQAHDIAVDVYMFMPDHVHLLLRGLTETAEMTGFMAGFKHDTGWQYRRERRQEVVAGWFSRSRAA